MRLMRVEVIWDYKAGICSASSMVTLAGTEMLSPFRGDFSSLGRRYMEHVETTLGMPTEMTSEAPRGFHNLKDFVMIFVFGDEAQEKEIHRAKRLYDYPHLALRGRRGGNVGNVKIAWGLEVSVSPSVEKSEKKMAEAYVVVTELADAMRRDAQKEKSPKTGNWIDSWH